ncbi:MAG: PQQ-binding-like beta-propeller repeat protein [Armatimonadota bacterium]|jgi:outer membrane protein assembly factor BamB
MPRPLVAIAILSASITAASSRAVAADDARAILDKMGVTRGICALLGDERCELAIDLARSSDLTLYVQLARADDVQAAARAADGAGLYGTRIFVAKGERTRIGLADSIADAVVDVDRSVNPPRGEVLRVLRPGGKAVQGQAELVRPIPEGMDDWSHHYHGPDNNPNSEDRLARAPYITQFIAEPRYAPAPQATVASAGRIFMAFGHVAWHKREERWLNTLIAMNGYNGTVLWRRPLTPGIMVDRSTMIATPDTLYLADEKSCKLLDAATGKLKDEITAPADMTGGTFWKWMALDDGVLYALVGKADALDTTARWRATRHGWPWNGISDVYNQPEYTWGMANVLLAIDPGTKKVLWHHRERQTIDSRALCMKNGRIFIGGFGRYIAALDSGNGNVVWRRTADKDPDIFKAIGPYRPGHGYIGGWKSTVYMKCTDEGLYIVGPQVEWLTALSAADGRVLWTYPRKDLHIVIRDDGLYTIGPQKSEGFTKKLDPLTGAILASYDVSRRACTRSVGLADGILFRASGGSVRLDLPGGRLQWISPMRPSCHIGVVPANGHLYWVPWVCDCNLQMFGAITLAPAGGFEFDKQTPGRERLEMAPGDPRRIAKLEQSPPDWPTYRADNGRSAQTHAIVPSEIHPLWTASPGSKLEPTAPVAVGGLVFLGGCDGIVHALDTATGKQRWRAYTGGAIRYPPSIADGRAFVGSGDGWAYAFEAATGRLLWRFRAAPVERRMPVYDSLLSTWPVGSGVLVDAGVAYFAAGITDYDGTHVYALDAATGEIKWQNNTCGHLDAFSRRGVACQGELLLHDGKLYLAGGNAVSPAAFGLAAGECLNDPPSFVGTDRPRGRELRITDQGVQVSGQPLYSPPDSPVYDKSAEWTEAIVQTSNADLLFRGPGEGSANAWSLVALTSIGGKTIWQQPLPAPPVRWGMAVDADGRIIVALRDGRLLCFG